jgi:hypothetical protein
MTMPSIRASRPIVLHAGTFFRCGGSAYRAYRFARLMLRRSMPSSSRISGHRRHHLDESRRWRGSLPQRRRSLPRRQTPSPGEEGSLADLAIAAERRDGASADPLVVDELLPLIPVGAPCLAHAPSVPTRAKRKKMRLVYRSP